MKYEKKSFTIASPGTKEYADNWERTFRGEKTRWGFDFFGTLTDPRNSDIRDLARLFHARGDEIHIISAISPGLPMDYAGMLKELDVPWTAVHRCDHVPAEKVAILQQLGCKGFWDDTLAMVTAARAAGIETCHAGVDPYNILK